LAAKGILKELAEFAVGVSFAEMPKPVVRQATCCFFDLMGCFFGGLSVEQNLKLLAMALDTNPKPEATVWGTGRKAGMAEAAFAHGCLAHHLEYDDGIFLGGHWGSETIAAVLAAAEVTGRGGSDLLAGIVVAYEVTV
jgi:2-methylcitrate dehydratase PrpD